MTMAAPEPLKVYCRGCHAKLDVSELEPFSYFPCPECGTRLRVPKRFDRYLLEKICGYGGMSTVYRAIEPELARRVAVKILNPESEANDGGKRFLAEARLVARVNHPGIIPIYNCGVNEARPFLVMRYMESGCLEQWQKEERLPGVRQIAAWLRNVTEGLDFALRREKIVHHDVKPGNILISAENEAKLGDFDLADVRDEGDSLTLCDGWGSPAYVSPERLLYGGEDFRGDIFSMGVTNYELMSGVSPFGITGEPEELLDRRSAGVARSLAELNPEVTPELSSLAGRMMSYAPEDRPDYAEVIACLKQFSEEETDV